jgi:hypothetical protein
VIAMSVSYDDAEVRAMLARLEAGLGGLPANRVVAEAGADTTREHLRKLSRTRHRGGVAHNFYGRAADAVVSRAVVNGALVAIPHEGLALRYFGGTVRPSGRVSLVTGKPIRKLAIPLSGTKAEGRTPGEFDNLRLVVTKAKKAFLAQSAANGMLSILFVLKKETTHKADAGVLPADDDYREGALRALDIYIEEAARG